MRKILPIKIDIRSKILDSRLWLILLIVFLASGIYYLKSAFAQESLTITAIPPRLELSALPGATLQETVKFRNDSPTEMRVQVITADFIVNDDQGTPIAVSEEVSGRWSLAKWITASPKNLVLPSGQTSTIDLVIAIPDDALPGGHYAMVTYEPIPEAGLEAGSGSEIRPKVGSLIYLNVVGDVVEAANLKSFSVADKFANYGPIKLSAVIENLGDVHFAPKGTVAVLNIFNDPIAEITLPDYNIFPFASRVYDFEVAGKWRLGRYKADLTATAGTSLVPIHGLIYFWIIPVKEIGLIALALIALIALIIVSRRKKHHQPDELTPESPTLTPPNVSS